MAAGTDIDRLIEMGLNRYGAGDIDGALVLWEEALAIDPDNAQAISYVEYVRDNYELLINGEPALASEDGFAIHEEPEYQIEIVPGELGSGDGAPLYMDPLDQGWFIARETGDETLDDDDEPAEHMTLELEADEPPDADEPPEFDDATREYLGPPSRPTPPTVGRPTSDFGSELQTSEFHHEEATGGFQHEGSSLGFSTQETEVRKRDLGFVQPSAPKPVKDTPSAPLAIGHAPTVDVQGHSSPFSTLEIEDVVPSLPKTNPRTETADIPLVPKVTTKDMPDTTRKPASPSSPPPRDPTSHSQAEVVLPHAPTRDFDDNRPRIEVGAPTRDLGIRPPSPADRSPMTSHDDDNEPTKQSDVRAIRAAAARNDGAMPATPRADGTRSDIVLPFDPIDARSAEVLEEVDAGASPDEAKDDQTRRRITMLLQKAIEYNAAQDLDRAVTAADLALSEDPNSALGQKLITRNKDTIMHVFQAFIGDLERQPQLAKPLHELASAPISPRAAFLLSRIDGTLTIDELLDVSGMPRMEAYRHLCQLFLRGILR